MKIRSTSRSYHSREVYQPDGGVAACRMGRWMAATCSGARLLTNRAMNLLLSREAASHVKRKVARRTIPAGDRDKATLAIAPIEQRRMHRSLLDPLRHVQKTVSRRACCQAWLGNRSRARVIAPVI